MSISIISRFPFIHKENKRVREPDWESLPIIAIAIIGIIGAVLIYNLLNEVVATEELPELKAEPIGIIEELLRWDG